MRDLDETQPITAQHKITSLNLVQSFHSKDDTEIELENVSATRQAFKIGSLGFLVPDGKTAEIVVDVEISTLPNSPEPLVGIGSIRAVAFPVFDLHRHFNAEPAADRYLLLIDFGSDQVALYVDSIPLLIAIKDDDEDIIEGNRNIDINLRPFVRKVYRKDFICLDFDFSGLLETFADD
jgi:chemotaxis signal transduction protein